MELGLRIVYVDKCLANRVKKKNATGAQLEAFEIPLGGKNTQQHSAAVMQITDQSRRHTL